MVIIILSIINGSVISGFHIITLYVILTAGLLNPVFSECFAAHVLFIVLNDKLYL